MFDDYSDLENRQKQLEFYTQALRIYQEIGDSVRKAKILDRLGLTYALLGEREKALESYQQELETLREVSQFYSKLGDSETALIFEYRQPIVLFSIGQLHAQLPDETNELEAYNLAIKIYKKWEDDQGETDFLIKIAEQYGKQDNPEKVLFFLNHAVTVYRETGNFQAEANLLREKIAGVYFYSLKDSEQGFEVLNKALNIYQKMGDIPEVAKTLDKIADLHLNLENREKALEFYNKVILVYQEINDLIQEVYTLRIIGKTYYELGNPEKALEVFNQAVKVFQEQGNREKSIENLLAIGEDYIQLEDKTTALIFYQQAIPITQQLGDYQKEAFILRKIGQLYYELESIHQAVKTFQDARKVYQKNSDRSGEAWTLYEIGKSYTILGDFPKAVDSYNQALEFFNKSLNLLNHQYPEAQAENLLGIAIVQRKQGNLDTALTQINIAILFIEETRTRKKSSEERLTFFVSKQDYYEFYIDLLMELHEQHPSKGYNAEALNISERSKARNFLELLTEANTDIRKGVDPELVIQERNLQQQLDAVERRRVELYNHDQSTQEQTTAIEQERQYLLQNYNKIKTQIREKSPSYAAITQPKPLTLEQIQQQILDDETLLLQYTLGEKRSFLWAVTKNSINSYELPPKAFIEEAVRSFFRSAILFNIGHSSINSLSASKSLSQIILAPVASQLNHQRLAIVSDGILHYLPFAALSSPTSLEKNDIPLIVHHEIVNLPSASTLSILRRDFQHRKPAPKTLAIIADPVFSSQDTRLEMPTVTHRESWEHYNLNRSTRQLDIGIWDRLPGTRREAEAILALVPPSESTFAFDFAANRDTVTNIQLNQYKIIHFATHGLFNSVNPELSGIVLSMVDQSGNSVNGFLRLHDIFNLDFSADLVVLSACKTGLGKQVRGEGLVGLTQGFMYAGTPRVLVSLWDVDDGATAEIMTRFYRLIFTEKLSAPEALRKAQLEMQTDTEWKSPYYWAAFILQGEWR